MPVSRFDYSANLADAGSFRAYRHAHWPPYERPGSVAMSLSDARPDHLGDEFFQALADLAQVIDNDWREVKDGAATERARLVNPAPAAEAMDRAAGLLPREEDRRATALRAAGIRHGYTEEILAALRDIDEDVTVVAGQIATWYGKDAGGFPTAFACRGDPTRERAVAAAQEVIPEVPDYLTALHQGLRLGELPAFGATHVFMMAGEGNLHPKHIAYFLPEDEGVKRSPFKKTYYFANTHTALLAALSAPLAERVLEVGEPFRADTAQAPIMSTLGVLGHEYGHSVHRETTRYRDLNSTHRWASVLLQEVCADVFGALVLAEVWAERVGLEPRAAVSYYLAESLRYVNRGLGSFPDSDGMFLQLSYLLHVGALEVTDAGKLRGHPEAVLAGLRSLARVLADAVLDGRAEPAITLHETFGPPAGGPLTTVLDRVADIAPVSVDYVNEDFSDLVPSGA